MPRLTQRFWNTLILVCTGCMMMVPASKSMAYEEAGFTIVHSTALYDVRRYQDRLVAETVYDDDGRGFQRLFGYISGDNKAASKIEMTVPVTQSTEIEMTAPVTQSAGEGGNVMQFHLPARFTADTAPVPTNPKVTIRTIEGGHFAVIRYSGRATDRNFAKHWKRLSAALQADAVRILATPMKATYNGPFTPFFLRRNEAMVRVDWP